MFIEMYFVRIFMVNCKFLFCMSLDFNISIELKKGFVTIVYIALDGCNIVEHLYQFFQKFIHVFIYLSYIVCAKHAEQLIPGHTV